MKVTQKTLEIPLIDLCIVGLDLRTVNLLEDAGYFRIKDLVGVTPEELAKINGMGEKTIRKIAFALKHVLVLTSTA